MSENALLNDPVFREAFLLNERQDRVHTGKVASALVFFLMPAGVALDHFVYPEHVGVFLQLRLFCSVLAAGLWFLHTTAFGEKHYRLLGLAIPMVPAVFIALMINFTEGPTSPYYAGLNLILLSVSVVVHWSLWESFFAIIGVLLIYLAAATPEATEQHRPIIFNNFYFLVLTGIIVVVGNYIFNRLRLREFALRFELDRNKQVLEKQKQDLEVAMQQLKEAEAELVQNEKLASIGRLGAGIMHEINNPLNYATTGLYTLRKQAKFVVPEQQAAYNETLTDVEEGVKRVSAIVSDLRSFAHHDNESVEEVPAVDVITSALRFMSHEWNEAHVKVEHNIPADQKLAVNKNKLIQVCVNLLQNSLDALKDKQFTDGESPVITITGRVENGLSLLVFRDNGPGIKPEHLDKIFDPFFTTKDVGEGMGMGLSISYRIVAEYQGRIRVNTEPGRYCEFTLEFPVKG